MTGTGAENNSWEEFDPKVYNSSSTFKVPKSCCEQFETNKIDECRKDPTAQDFKVTGCVMKLKTKFYENRNNCTIAGSTILGLMVCEI